MSDAEATKPAARSRRTKQTSSTVTAQNGVAKPATRGPSLRVLTRTASERHVQSQIVQGLQMLGYVVLEVGGWARRAHCQACGATFVPAHANSVGAPDLFVSRRAEGAHLPGNKWVAMEVKRPRVKTLLGTVEGGRLSPEQRALVEAGIVSVIHSLEEALDVLEGAGL